MNASGSFSKTPLRDFTHRSGQDAHQLQREGQRRQHRVERLQPLVLARLGVNEHRAQRRAPQQGRRRTDVRQLAQHPSDDICFCSDRMYVASGTVEMVSPSHFVPGQHVSQDLKPAMSDKPLCA